MCSFTWASSEGSCSESVFPTRSWALTLRLRLFIKSLTMEWDLYRQLMLDVLWIKAQELIFTSECSCSSNNKSRLTVIDSSIRINVEHKDKQSITSSHRYNYVKVTISRTWAATHASIHMIYIMICSVRYNYNIYDVPLTCIIHTLYICIIKIILHSISHRMHMYRWISHVHS